MTEFTTEVVPEELPLLPVDHDITDAELDAIDGMEAS
jgi:hypothetical protein